MITALLFSINYIENVSNKNVIEVEGNEDYICQVWI